MAVVGSDNVEAAARPLIFVVEPNPFMAEMERSILRSYAVEFLSPEAVVRAAVSRQPDLIIAEIVLRGRDGLALCRELKARPETAAIPFLVFSVVDAAAEAAEAGADAFLLKPSERNALAYEVRRLIGPPRSQGREATP